MAAREQMGQNLDVGFVQRIAQGLRYAITGVGPTNFFGPAQPLTPIAQDEVVGRAHDYPVAYNLRITPRSDHGVSFAQLRQLADAYDLMRLIIETRKDQIEAYDFELVPVDDKAKPDSRADDISKLMAFFERPDRENYWPQWLRAQLEDLFVLDAICVYPRPTRGGGVYSFELIDPATITRKINDDGRTPLPPDVAYQQIIKGLPAADYSADTLIYMRRNVRTNRIYGYSPVEQVMTTVNIALRRQMSQLEFYTAGNVPEALAQAPDTWNPKQIEEFQAIWDSLMEGNTANRRKMRFIPSLDNIVFPKAEMLKDEFDEWLARITCFAFSVSPSALIKQVNRASGEQMAETAKEEGLMPLLRFLEVHFTSLVQRLPGGQGLKFKFRVQAKVAPMDQSKIDASDVENQIRSPDECRADRGMEPMADDEREKWFPAPPEPMPPTAGVDGAPPNPRTPKPGKPPQGAAPTVKPAAGPVGKGDTFISVHIDGKAIEKAA